MIVIDIEMPERCGLCPCFHAEHPMHCQLIKPPDKNKQLAAPYGLPRPEWCPLKEQKAMKPIYSEEMFGDHLPHCPVCKKVLPSISQYGKLNFCYNCGLAVILK